jgi:hypothetical protein
LQPIRSLAAKIVAMGMRRNIQALARPILPDEFGVWSFTNYVATPTNLKVLINGTGTAFDD